MIRKSFKAFLLILFIFSSFINITFVAQCDDTVSERELLLLTVISYSNEQEIGREVKLTNNMIKFYQWDSGMVSQDEVRGWTVLDFDINDNSSKDGFSIYVFKKGKNIVITPRGTDGGMFTENWKYLISNEHSQAKYMEKYVSQLVPILAKDKDCKIYFCGHSLGGYLALYGTGVLMQYPEICEHFVKTITFNGLGLGKNTNKLVMNELYKLKKEQILNYRINGDIISHIGDHITSCISLNLVKSNLWDVFSAHRLTCFFFNEPFSLKSQLEDVSDDIGRKRKTEISDKNFENELTEDLPIFTMKTVTV